MPFRNAAKTVVRLTPGFEVVGEAESGEQAVDLAAELKPELVLMDINLPGIDGIEALRRIISARPETMGFLVSTIKESDLPSDARTCGAAAFISKESFEPAILTSLWETRGDAAWRG
jgi:DNA-binding NarL/FixJ family response regulator